MEREYWRIEKQRIWTACSKADAGGGCAVVVGVGDCAGGLTLAGPMFCLKRFYVLR